MNKFSGFPIRMQFTSIPNLFFSTLLPQISDMAELKTTLHIFATLYHKRGYLRYTTYGELSSHKSLMSSLREGTEPAEVVLRRALEMATRRGTVLHLILDKDGVSEDVYFLNTQQNKEIVAKIQKGEASLSGLKVKAPPYSETEEQPDIFALYEQNIGMLTPLIADELREAEKLYPVAWIRDAIKEAVKQEKHKWSYISAILERWAAEGKTDGTYRRDSKKAPDKYIKGKYGHMVRR